MADFLELPKGIRFLGEVYGDERYGPWNSINEALTQTEGRRVKGLKVGVIINSKTIEYWFKDGIEDSNLVPFNTSVAWSSTDWQSNSDSITFRKIKELPSTPQDGLYFTKKDGESSFKFYIVDNGNVNELDISSSSSVIASDSETQTGEIDNKSVSPLKLKNWWSWVKGQTQTIAEKWTFNKTVTLGAGSSTNAPLKMTQGGLLASLADGTFEYDGNELYFTKKTIRYRLLNDFVYNSSNETYSQLRLASGEQILASSPIELTSNNSTTSGTQMFSPVGLASASIIHYYMGNFYTGFNPSIDYLKCEIFVRIANGWFSNSSTGSSTFNTYKIGEVFNPFSIVYTEVHRKIDFIITTNNQNKNDILNAQWSTINFIGKTIDANGVQSDYNTSTLYLRDSANTRAFAASEISLYFYTKSTIAVKTDVNLTNTIAYDNILKGITISKIK